MFPATAVIAIAPGFRMQWEEAQQAHVLLYPEGMVKLNQSAGEILGCCDGKRTVGEILGELRRRFPDADLDAHVHEFLDVAHAQGWISQRQAPGSAT